MTLTPDDASSVTEGDDPMFTIRGLVLARNIEVGDDLHMSETRRVEAVNVRLSTVAADGARIDLVLEPDFSLDVTRIVDENLETR